VILDRARACRRSLGRSRSVRERLLPVARRMQQRMKIEELWSPLIKTWFTEGVDDPRITVIKVTPTEGYYWDNKHGSAVAGVKMLIGRGDRQDAR
jgi:hypothetical protein